jgi:hypothetical protein
VVSARSALNGNRTPLMRAYLVAGTAGMQGVVVVRRPVPRNVPAARRMAAAMCLALLGVCCYTLVAVRQPADQSVLKGGAAQLDPDAPHARASTARMYVSQFDPDAPAAPVARAHGLRLELGMQSVLANMAKGARGHHEQSQKAAHPMYNPSADPDAPSHRDSEVRSPLGLKMRARLAAETRMDQQLKLKAQVAELSPKYMPTTSDSSMMLNLKSSKPGHITFDSPDSASKDDRAISKQVAGANTHAEAAHEHRLREVEQAKAALLEKRRKQQESWINHNWAVNGPPKRPGFAFMQNLVSKDMAAGHGPKRIEQDEKKVMAKYDKLKGSYDSWERQHNRYGTE